MKKLKKAAFCFVLAIIFSSCNIYITKSYYYDKNEQKQQSQKDTIQSNEKFLFDFIKNN